MSLQQTLETTTVYCHGEVRTLENIMDLACETNQQDVLVEIERALLILKDREGSDSELIIRLLAEVQNQYEPAETLTTH